MFFFRWLFEVEKKGGFVQFFLFIFTNDLLIYTHEIASILVEENIKVTKKC